MSKRRILIVSRVSLFPPEHGGAKNILSVIDKATRGGDECRVLVLMHPDTPERRRFSGQHRDDLKSLLAAAPTLASSSGRSAPRWNLDGVSYEGVSGGSAELAQALKAETAAFLPDSIFLCDDGLDEASELFEFGARSGRMVFLAQTIHCLPFGPFSMRKSEALSNAIRGAKQIIAPSLFVRDYFREHLGIEATVRYPNVFGSPPFRKLGSVRNRFVTMINPCPWKGSSIFTRIARARPDLEFAAVPTWGATEPLLRELKGLRNVTLLEETPEIDKIFSQTRVLLVPSLCQEAFGLVSPEALLRGVPVVAAEIGGLRESTLGVAPLIPVVPLSFASVPRGDGHPQLGWAEPENRIENWLSALDEILSSESAYEKISNRSKARAEEFVKGLGQQEL